MATETTLSMDAVMGEVMPSLVARGWRLVLFSPHFDEKRWQANIIRDLNFYEADCCRGFGATAAEAIADGAAQVLASLAERLVRETRREGA